MRINSAIFFPSWICFCRKPAQSNGMASSRRLLPVGAVSKTITSASGSSRNVTNWSNVAISSAQGVAIIPSPKVSFICPVTLFSRDWKTPRASFGLMFKPRRLGTRRTGVRSLPPMCCPNMTERLTVGSVETMVVLYPWSANQTAVAVAMVVLPTPPFPPKKIYLVSALRGREACRMFPCRRLSPTSPRASCPPTRAGQR